MKIIKGDLIKLAQHGKFDAIVHGCNCFHNMGSGIAKQIKRIFPNAYDVDSATSYGDNAKLGKISYTINDKLSIINGYTQFKYGRNKQHADYKAIRSVFRIIASTFPNKRIGYPKIGAGLAGGDWNIISKIIEEELSNMDHTLVIYVPGE